MAIHIYLYGDGSYCILAEKAFAVAVIKAGRLKSLPQLLEERGWFQGVSHGPLGKS